MIKAKEVSVKNIVLFLVFALAISAGYFISKPQVAATKSVPIFIGEEIVVQKADKAVSAIKIAKAATLPVPQPKVITPLPIVPPSITYKVLPSYPLAALNKGLEGAVILSVYVGLGGQPEKVEIKTSSGVSELDDSARAAVSQWKFSPAAQAGAPLSSWFELPVRFTIK